MKGTRIVYTGARKEEQEVRSSQAKPIEAQHFFKLRQEL